jgi:ferrochelatase
VRRYLGEFLSDPRVVALPRWLWLPILHGIVLRSRPARSAAKYAAIWTPEGSPLAVHTRKQSELLGSAMAGTRVDYAMRYGEPSIRSALERLARCDRIVALPLYPQYSASTTQSVRDALPAHVEMIESFHDHPAYVAALAAGARAHCETHGRAEKLVMSFHGLPERALAQGDPYREQCLATAALLASELELNDSEFLVTFQSRFGAARWLQPYTQPTLVELARAGVKRVDVICPGFVSDCLETLEEIGIEARHAFREAGGGELRLIPCLNESPEWIAALARLASERLAGPGRRAR